MKKALELLLCATMLMGLLAGCGGSKEQSTGDSGDGEESAASAKVAYLTPSLDVPFWRYVRHGIEDELGKSGIECVTYDSKDDANTQLSNAQDALTKQVDAIIISPTDSASCVSVLSAAEEAGVPVVICDIGTDSGEYVSYISTDQPGRRQGHRRVHCLPAGARHRGGADHSEPGPDQRRAPQGRLR